MTSLLTVSTPETLASTTVTFFASRRMPRIGDAMSAGDRPAVAT